jgi:hypothetical protein
LFGSCMLVGDLARAANVCPGLTSLVLVLQG